jgi:gliding motility-associated-like protein
MLVLAVVLSCISFAATAQITSPGADHVKILTYPVSDREDPLFVFYQSNGKYVPGSLVATAPVPGSFDFTWNKYDTSTSSFSIPAGSDAGATSSTITGLNDGGYRVQITNGVDVDTFFIAWVMLNDLVVETEKNALGNVPSNKSGCSDGNFLVVGGTAVVDSFFFYDPLFGDEVQLENDIDILWTSDNPDLTIPNANVKAAMEANYTEDPPVVDTWYILSVTDSLGMTDVDSVFYDTKHTRAEFTVDYWDKINAVWSPDLTGNWSLEEGSLDAPLTVRFTNLSQSGVEFRWVFVDSVEESSGTRFIEDEEAYDTLYAPEYTYMSANDYFYPYLVSVSDQNCTDTFRLEEGIFVEPSDLVVPNVFSPNGDGANDVFLFKHQSIRSCRVTIIDRFGKTVYRKQIDDLYEWEGWDGTVLTGAAAPEGQYYYVVEALGYDGLEYRDQTLWEQRRNNRENGSNTSTGNGTEEDTQVSTRYTGWLYLYRHLRQ